MKLFSPETLLLTKRSGFLLCLLSAGDNMGGEIYVEIRDTPLDVSRACSLVADPAHGAIDTFIGAVRNHHQGKQVTGISYDVHIELTEKTLREICKEARGLWPETKYYVAHYRGALDIGGISVLIAVSAPH